MSPWQLVALLWRAEGANITPEDSEQAGDIWCTVNKCELGSERGTAEAPLTPILASLAL